MSRSYLLTSMSVITLMMLLGGCATSTQAVGWTLPDVPKDLPAAPATLALPFDSYTLSNAELGRMQAEQVRMLASCAAGKGLDIAFGGDYIRPEDNTYLNWGGRLGTMDLAHAAEFGYHPSADGTWSPIGGFYIRDPGNIQPAGTADPNALKILYGVDAPGAESTSGGGCYAEVEREIGVTLIPIFDVESDLINLSLEHPSVRAANKAWIRCMSSMGYEYKSVQGPAEGFTMAALSVAETKVAVADVGCIASSNWSQIFHFVLTDYQDQAIAKDKQRFDSALSAQHKRLAFLDKHRDGPTS